VAQFTDDKGITWDIQVTLGALWEYKQACGVDIFNSAMGGRVPAVDLLGLAYYAARKQARERGYMSDMDWLNGLGKRCFESLLEAVSQELEEFFPEAPKGAADSSDFQKASPGTGKPSTP